jgi:hypothetical protein
VRLALVLLSVTLVLLVLPAGGGSVGGKPWLWQCTQIHNAEAQFRCYVRLLREDIERSRDPAGELPRIDRRVLSVGGPVAASCHVLMHQVGRDYARAHRLTLESLQRYVPRSNNPNCSAGFGMGLVMYLGPEILRSGGRAAVKVCERLPTRYRAYTCVHGLGHALMRAYHGNLGQSVRACRALRPASAPDCAQGAFHDYWISFRGADGTTRLGGANASPRVVCDGRLTYVRPCWYRYFLEQPIVLQFGRQKISSASAAAWSRSSGSAASAQPRSPCRRIPSTRCASAQACAAVTRAHVYVESRRRLSRESRDGSSG